MDRLKMGVCWVVLSAVGLSAGRVFGLESPVNAEPLGK